MITDFGLAKEGIFEEKLTRTILGGGQSYLIPEVLKGIPYDKSVDIYLYGLLAYEMLVGRPVYPSSENEEMLKKKILKGSYEIPKDILSENARDLLSKLIVVEG